MRVLVPLGTRPEIIKLAPVVAALRASGFRVRTVATGQHYDPSLTDAFFDDLAVHLDERWTLDGTDGERVGTIVSLAYREIEQHRPDVVLLLGDTYTVPVFCLAARHHGVPVAHLEAGMRSFNQTSVEEANRRVAGALASLHLAATQTDARFLEAEGVAPETTRVVGNPVIDAIRTRGVARVPPEDRAGAVVTLHRRTNVDDPGRLQAAVELLHRLADELAPVTFPVHPRTRIRLEQAGALESLAGRGIRLLSPVPYDQMLGLLSHARVALTDSGGIQEEASWFGVPLVVLRHSTPRWDGIRTGTAVLSGLDPARAIRATRHLCSPGEQRRIAALPCPYGDGHTAERVARLLADPTVLGVLRLTEPDFVDGDIPAAGPPLPVRL